MFYFDLHTHQPPFHPEDSAIIQIDLSKKPGLSPSDTTPICSDGLSLLVDKTSMLLDTAAYASMTARKQNADTTPMLSDTAPFSSDAAMSSSNFYSVGIHPWQPDESLLPELQRYALLSSVLAIGETGLDKTRASTPHEWELQHSLFEAHIRLSEEVKKPLIIHCVKAWDELLHIRKITHPTMPWIIHGFRGKGALATQLLNSGFYLSFGPLHHPDALKAAWSAHRLFAETDDKLIDIRTVYQKIAHGLHIPVRTLSLEIARLLRS